MRSSTAWDHGKRSSYGIIITLVGLEFCAVACSSMSDAWCRVTGRNLDETSSKSQAHSNGTSVSGNSNTPPPPCDLNGISKPQLANRNSLAVVDFFVEKSLGSTIDRGLADICRSAIQESGLFILVDRENMLTILGEEDFASAIKCDDTRCLVDYGKKLRAQKMVHGRLSQVGEAFVLTIKLTDVSTGKVDSFKTSQIRGSTDELLKWVQPQTCLLLREAAITK